MKHKSNKFTRIFIVYGEPDPVLLNRTRKFRGPYILGLRSKSQPWLPPPLWRLSLMKPPKANKRISWKGTGPT